MTNLTNSLERFLEHERQETEVLTELNAALEAHCKAIGKLAEALAQVRRELFYDNQNSFRLSADPDPFF